MGRAVAQSMGAAPTLSSYRYNPPREGVDDGASDPCGGQFSRRFLERQSPVFQRELTICIRHESILAYPDTSQAGFTAASFSASVFLRRLKTARKTPSARGAAPGASALDRVAETHGNQWVTGATVADPLSQDGNDQSELAAARRRRAREFRLPARSAGRTPDGAPTPSRTTTESYSGSWPRPGTTRP